MSDPWAPPPAAGPAPGSLPPYPPYPPPPRPGGRSNTGIVLIVGGVLTVVAVLVGASILGAVNDRRQRERETRRAEEAFSRATDRALVREPARLAAGRRFASSPPEAYAHAFTLPVRPGWEARDVGEQISEREYYDSLLTNADARAVLIVTRLPLARGPVGGDQAAYLRAVLDREPGVVAGTTTDLDIAGEAAVAADVANREGDEVRVVLFAHGGEMFRFDVAAPSLAGDSRPWRDVRAMLSGIRWG